MLREERLEEQRSGKEQYIERAAPMEVSAKGSVVLRNSIVEPIA